MEYNNLSSEDNGKLFRHMRICVNSMSQFRSIRTCDIFYVNFSNCEKDSLNFKLLQLFNRILLTQSVESLHSLNHVKS